MINFNQCDTAHHKPNPWFDALVNDLLKFEGELFTFDHYSALHKKFKELRHIRHSRKSGNTHFFPVNGGPPMMINCVKMKELFSNMSSDVQLVK